MYDVVVNTTRLKAATPSMNIELQVPEMPTSSRYRQSSFEEFVVENLVINRCA